LCRAAKRPDCGSPACRRLSLAFAWLDQIAVGRNRLWGSTDRVNLVYTFEVERIHALDWNGVAVPIKRDPL
jgi:hypothetical protein